MAIDGLTFRQRYDAGDHGFGPWECTHCGSTQPAIRIPGDEGECGECMSDPRIDKLEGDRNRYSAALDEIAARGCSKPVTFKMPAVRETYVCRKRGCLRDDWCAPCIAADARKGK